MHKEVWAFESVPALEARARELMHRGQLGEALSAVQVFVDTIIHDPRTVARIFSSLVLDMLCKEAGEAFVRTGAAVAPSACGGTVVLVSELSLAGGHNEIIKDIVKLKLFQGPVSVVLTDCFNRADAQTASIFSDESSVAVHQVSGHDHDQKLKEVCEFLCRQSPKNLLVLVHNQDSVGISSAFAWKALSPEADIVYVHHGDHHLSIGAATDDFIHIDPHNIGYFHCRCALNHRSNRYWPLTVRSGERANVSAFLGGGSLVTCSSGRSEKFEAGSYLYDYFELISRVLRASGGKHVHIGELTVEQRIRLTDCLIACDIDASKFVHVPFVPSLVDAFSSFGVDLYVSSFPLGGGKATVEAMAAGVPLLMHESYRSRFHGGVDLAYPGAFVWRDEAELLDIVRKVDRETLVAHAEMALAHYVRFHSAQVLAVCCDFERPLDTDLIPPLRNYSPDAIKLFFDDKRASDAQLAAYEREAMAYENQAQGLGNQMVDYREKIAEYEVQAKNLTAHLLAYQREAMAYQAQEQLLSSKLTIHEEKALSQQALVHDLNEQLEKLTATVQGQEVALAKLREQAAEQAKERALNQRKLEDFDRSETERARLEAETHRLHGIVLAMRNSDWFRLGTSLRTGGFSFSNIRTVVKLVAKMTLPARVQDVLRAWRQEHRPAPAGIATPAMPQANDNLHGYLVQLPSVVRANRPRVLHVIANFCTGGSSRLVVDLIEKLGGDFEQHVLTSFIPSPPDYRGLSIHELRFPSDMQPFVAHYRAIQPALIHLHYWGDCDEPWYAKAVEAAKHLGLPVIQNINTPIAPYRSDAVVRYVYVSDYVRRVFGSPEAEHVTVYPGSDFGLFTRSPSERAPSDCVGMVYRLERDKLNEDGIQPFIRIAQMRPQTRILIVGGGSLFERYRDTVTAAGVAANFEFTGYVSYEELPALYRRMSLFVAPVWKESFGQVSPFAMSMKVPVIGYDIGAIGEIVDDPSLLAPPADAEALARIAVDLLDAPESIHRLGEVQQRRAEDNFSIQAMIANYARIYAEVSEQARKDSA